VIESSSFFFCFCKGFEDECLFSSILIDVSVQPKAQAQNIKAILKETCSLAENAF